MRTSKSAEPTEMVIIYHNEYLITPTKTFMHLCETKAVAEKPPQPCHASTELPRAGVRPKVKRTFIWPLDVNEKHLHVNSSWTDKEINQSAN